MKVYILNTNAGPRWLYTLSKTVYKVCARLTNSSSHQSHPDSRYLRHTATPCVYTPVTSHTGSPQVHRTWRRSSRCSRPRPCCPRSRCLRHNATAGVCSGRWSSWTPRLCTASALRRHKMIRFYIERDRWVGGDGRGGGRKWKWKHLKQEIKNRRGIKKNKNI